MEVIITSDRKLGYFTYLRDLLQPTFIGVISFIDPKYQQDIPAHSLRMITHHLEDGPPLSK